MSDEPDYEIAIFIAGAKVPREDRAAFLENACGSDANLRRKVEALLEAHDRVGNFLEDPPPNETY